MEEGFVGTRYLGHSLDCAVPGLRCPLIALSLDLPWPYVCFSVLVRCQRGIEPLPCILKFHLVIRGNDQCCEPYSAGTCEGWIEDVQSRCQFVIVREGIGMDLPSLIEHQRSPNTVVPTVARAQVMVRCHWLWIAAAKAMNIIFIHRVAPRTSVRVADCGWIDNAG